METIFLNDQKITLKEKFDKSIFENLSWSNVIFRSHYEVAAALENKHPYTISILIELLDYKLRNKKEYVKKTRVPIVSKYRELLYDGFFKDYGDSEGNNVFSKWLKKYRPLWQKEHKHDEVDDYIVVNEFEPRYRQKILARFKDHNKLFQERYRIERSRYYNIPEPLNYIDWRNPYDNIFVWEENSKKVARRGGSGSSGSRETNSMFILGLLELNKTKSIPSCLFLYSQDNILLFIKKFDRLCVPTFDIGSNYHFVSSEEVEKIKKSGTFLKWDIGVKEIETIEVIHS